MLDTVNVRFVIGSRVLLSIPRRLQTVVQPLEALIAGGSPEVPAEADESHGYRFLAIPAARVDQVRSAFPDHLIGSVKRQRRFFVDLEGSFDDYLAGFSSKTRSTLNRKRRKLSEANEGHLHIEAFRTPGELARFLELAENLSVRTYQARHLDCGLPTSTPDRRRFLAMAAADEIRAYLLFLHGRPVSYLLLTARGDALCYDYLGYDPEVADLSPGTVLQIEAFRELFADRFRYFDFTDGEGAHKQMFATGSVETSSFLLLKRNLANFTLLRGLEQFDTRVEQAKGVANRFGATTAVRRALRR